MPDLSMGDADYDALTAREVADDLDAWEPGRGAEGDPVTDAEEAVLDAQLADLAEDEVLAFGDEVGAREGDRIMMSWADAKAELEAEAAWVRAAQVCGVTR